MFQTVVGVDIAKHKFDAARLAMGKYKHKKFDNTPEDFSAFATWLATLGTDPVLVCMEATGTYSIPLADYLVQSSCPVAVVNPAKIKGFAKSELSRLKTDKADAKLIARYALEKQPPLWTPPPANIRELQALLRRIEDLLEMQQMEQNRLDTASAHVKTSINTVLVRLDEELKETRAKVSISSIMILISSNGVIYWKLSQALPKRPPRICSWHSVTITVLPTLNKRWLLPV